MTLAVLSTVVAADVAKVLYHVPQVETSTWGPVGQWMRSDCWAEQKSLRSPKLLLGNLRKARSVLVSTSSQRDKVRILLLSSSECCSTAGCADWLFVVATPVSSWPLCSWTNNAYGQTPLLTFSHKSRTSPVCKSVLDQDRQQQLSTQSTTMSRLSRLWSLGRHHRSPVVNVVKLQGKFGRVIWQISGA